MAYQRRSLRVQGIAPIIDGPIGAFGVYEGPARGVGRAPGRGRGRGRGGTQTRGRGRGRRSRATVTLVPAPQRNYRRRRRSGPISNRRRRQVAPAPEVPQRNYRRRRRSGPISNRRRQEAPAPAVPQRQRHYRRRRSRGPISNRRHWRIYETSSSSSSESEEDDIFDAQTIENALTNRGLVGNPVYFQERAGQGIQMGAGSAPPGFAPAINNPNAGTATLRMQHMGGDLLRPALNTLGRLFSDVRTHNLVGGGGHARPHVIVNAIRAMRNNDALTEDLLAGYTIREIRDLIHRAGAQPRNFYLSCKAVQFTIGPGTTLAGRWDGRREQSIRDRIRQGHNLFITEKPIFISKLCLGDVRNYDTTLQEANALEDEPIQPDTTDQETAMSYFLQVMQDQLQNAAANGSSVDTHVIFTAARLVKRRQYPNREQIMRRYAVFSAGFDTVLYRSSQLNFKMLPASGFPVGFSEYSLFVPGGPTNCFLDCICEAIMLACMDPIRFRLSSRDEGIRDKLAKEFAIRKVNNMLHKLQNTFIMRGLQNNGAMVAKRGENYMRNSLKRSFARKIKYGFSNQFVNEVRQYMMDYFRFDIEVQSQISAGEIMTHVPKRPSSTYTDSPSSSPRTYLGSFNGLSSVYKVLIVKVNYQGNVYNAGEIVEDEEQMEDEQQKGGRAETMSLRVGRNKIVHVCLIHPYPMGFRNCSSKLAVKKIILSGELKNALHKVFDVAHKLAKPDQYDLVSVNEIPVLLEVQNERWLNYTQEYLPRMLAIQDEQKQADREGIEVDFVDPEKTDLNRILVYDMESVENLIGFQTDLVYPRFRQRPPPDLPEDIPSNMFGTVESQIPYTVQYGFLKNSCWTSQTQEERETADPLNSTTTTPLENNEVFVVNGYCEEDGKKYLGYCVTQFLDALEVYVKANNVKRIFAYAHNGSAFDVFLIKAFNYKYEMEEILVTPRGILSLTILLTKEGGGRRVIFRDTRVFFGGSLAELCTIFKVPKKYCKTDFPITLVHGRNCYDTRIEEAYKEYIENDVYCLAYVVAGINNVMKTFGGLVPKTCTFPHITQFITLMSAVKRYQKQLFTKFLRVVPPLPVDIPALRKWISQAVIGGRTSAYWRCFANAYSNYILFDTTTRSHVEERKEVWRQMKQTGDYAWVLDVTSLYPYSMFEYPIPTDTMKGITYKSRAHCLAILMELDCKDCRNEWKLCKNHRCGGPNDIVELGCCFFIITKLKFEPSHLWQYRVPICPRKMNKQKGLAYHFEHNEELLQKFYELRPDHPRSENHFPEVFCYPMYDVLWLQKCGWTFDLLGGIHFEGTYAYRGYTYDLFLKRIAAKQVEQREGLPKSLSTFYKLFYNGGYGINVQKDITENHIITREEDEGRLRSDKKLAPDERIIRNAHTHQCENGQWILKIEKDEVADEFFSDQSPSQIGAYVTAASRHHMNLAMYRGCKHGFVGYTDTDSICFLGAYTQTEMPESILDESTEAKMGTYKNDHEEGKEELCFLSLFVAKKIKVHFTLDKEGQVRIYPTFKGFNPPSVCPITGKKMSVLDCNRIKVLAIIEAFFTGEVKPLSQTEFRRDIAKGITIDKHAQFSASKEAILGHSQGYLIRPTFLTNLCSPRNHDHSRILLNEDEAEEYEEGNCCSDYNGVYLDRDGNDEPIGLTLPYDPYHASITEEFIPHGISNLEYYLAAVSQDPSIHGDSRDFKFWHIMGSHFAQPPGEEEGSSSHYNLRRDCRNPEERLNFWEKRLGRVRLERFVNDYYDQQHSDEALLPHSMEYEADFQQFQKIFEDAPMLNPSDKTSW